MAFSKKIRQDVYDKYNGHCAYCGCELKLSEMQIDHMNSKYYAERHGKDIDNSIDNLMPSCRQCNFYKSESNIEGFRNKLDSILKYSCKKAFTVRLAVKYGFLNIGEWDGKFYFERIKPE